MGLAWQLLIVLNYSKERIGQLRSLLQPTYLHYYITAKATFQGRHVALLVSLGTAGTIFSRNTFSLSGG